MELVVLYVAAIVLAVMVVMQSKQLYERQKEVQSTNVQQTQIENAIKALTQFSN